MRKFTLLTLSLISICYSEHSRQDRFIIASWYDPDFTGVDSIDEQRLQTFRDAHFNTLTGLNGVGASKFEVSNIKAKFPSIHYKINRVSKIPGLRTMIWDERFSKKKAKDAVLNVKDVTKSLQNVLTPDAVLGYNVWDEPEIPDIKEVNTWITQFRIQDSIRIAWANLYPFHMGFPTWDVYSNYVDSYFNQNNCMVASFDYYPFRAGGVWNTYGKKEPNYFKSLELFSRKAAQYKGNFWSFIYTSQENKEWDTISKENIQFMVFASVAYGAKGIVYYTYGRQPENISSIVDEKSKPTAIYYWVRDINRKIDKIGSLLMSLTWYETIHESSIDTGYSGNSLEKGLPVLTPNDQIIRSCNSKKSSFSIGKFKKDNMDYLIIFNKDRTDYHDITIKFKKPVFVWELVIPTGKFTNISKLTKSVLLKNVGAANLRIITLTNKKIIEHQ